MREKRLTPEQLLEYLALNNPASIPQIAKALKVNTATVQWHIEKLIDKNIVKPLEPKKYGEKYTLNIKLRSWIDLAILIAPTIIFIVATMIIYLNLNQIFMLPQQIQILITLLTINILVTLALAIYTFTINIKYKIYMILKKHKI